MKLEWDNDGTRKYNLGVSKAVLYKYDATKTKWIGYAWTGMTNVTQSPEGGEANDLYADNILYASLRGTEKMSGSLECYDYPPEFENCIGGDELIPGVTIRQQPRDNFALCYRSEIGESNDPYIGYKIHIIYDCTANAAERVSESINDSPDTEPLSFDFDSVPVKTTGKKPVSTLEIDSTKVAPAILTKIEAALYGTDDKDPYLLFPDDIADLVSGG